MGQILHILKIFEWRERPVKKMISSICWSDGLAAERLIFDEFSVTSNRLKKKKKKRKNFI